MIRVENGCCNIVSLKVYFLVVSVADAATGNHDANDATYEGWSEVSALASIITGREPKLPGFLED